ncbi:protein odr-4 homolog [Gastrophryne carolinensis]
MGRSYYVDEAIESYLTNLVQEKNSFVTGLLIGQISLQRDYIVRAVKTPEREQGEIPEKKPNVSKLDDIDEEWFAIHASQVSRMLPGGLVLAGVFLISSPELSKDPSNVLKKLIFAAEKFERKNRWEKPNNEEIADRAAVHVCPRTKKIVCRTFDVKDPKSTAKPADWKYQRTPFSWITIDCNINVDLTIPLSSSSNYQDWQKCTRNRLVEWAKEVEDYTILFNGKLKDKDEDLVEDQKKYRSFGHSGLQIVSATVLSPSNASSHSTACVRICNSSLNIQGIIKCRGFICNNKPKVRDAIQVIKRDILNTLSYRCEITFEDILFNGPQHESEKSVCLPQRVFFPVPGSSLMLCDYVFGDETKEDLQSRFLEILDQKVNYDDLIFTEEKNVTSSGT